MGKRNNEIIEWIQAIVIAIVLAFVIKTFLFDTLRVDGSSMEPTLHDNDRLIISKISYIVDQPKRGDIAVFKYPGNPKEYYIKRVIAIGNDKIKIENGNVYVNGELKIEPYIKEKTIVGFKESVIPEGTIFVLGDNRNDSTDSRRPSVGYVPLDNMVGKAVFRIWPFDKINLIDQ
ncbi:MAG: signal peptidase I [Clostridia bacterium]|nr:signal peptidase I [Clostridia bacterium]